MTLARCLAGRLARFDSISAIFVRWPVAALTAGLAWIPIPTPSRCTEVEGGCRQGTVHERGQPCSDHSLTWRASLPPAPVPALFGCGAAIFSSSTVLDASPPAVQVLPGRSTVVGYHGENLARSFRSISASMSKS